VVVDNFRLTLYRSVRRQRQRQYADFSVPDGFGRDILKFAKHSPSDASS
jgi:hypothetical protein